jgi:hypothetical protein
MVVPKLDQVAVVDGGDPVQFTESTLRVASWVPGEAMPASISIDSRQVRPRAVGQTEDAVLTEAMQLPGDRIPDDALRAKISAALTK